MIARASISAALAVAALGIGATGASAGTIGLTGPASVAEGSGGTVGMATYTVTETRASGETLPAGSWTLAVNGATATAGADFGAPSPASAALSTGSCAMSTCQSTFTVNVPIVGDDVFEGNETFTASLTAPSGVTVSSPVTTTIVDDDPAPALEVGGDKVVEGNTGTTLAKASFELRAPATAPVTIRWATEDGTATAGSDYAARSGTATIPVGQREAHASIPVSGDTTIEPDERFGVRVTSVQNATLDDDGATVTILNDDVPPPPPPSVTSPLHVGGATGQTGSGTGHAPSSTTTPTGAAGPGASDLLGPVMRLGYAGLTAKGKAKLRVECPATEQGFCSGRLRLLTKLHGRDVTLGTATFRHIRGGTVEVVKVSLSRRARRTLRLAGSFSVKVRARDAAGNVATTDPVFAA